MTKTKRENISEGFNSSLPKIETNKKETVLYLDRKDYTYKENNFHNNNNNNEYNHNVHLKSKYLQYNQLFKNRCDLKKLYTLINKVKSEMNGLNLPFKNANNKKDKNSAFRQNIFKIAELKKKNIILNQER